MKHFVLGLLALGVAATVLPVEARESASQRRERLDREAREQFNKLVPDCQNAYNEKRYDDAIAACTKLIEAKALEGENLGSVYMMRGTAYQSKDDCAKAVADFELAAPLRPQDYLVPYAQYICAVKTKDDAKAASTLDQAIALKPDDIDLIRGRCAMRFNKRDFKGAIPDCEKVTNERPNDADIWLALAQAYESEKQMDKAKTAYAKLLALKPGDQTATDGLKRVGGR